MFLVSKFRACYAQVFMGLDLQHAELVFGDDIQTSYKPFSGTYYVLSSSRGLHINYSI